MTDVFCGFYARDTTVLREATDLGQVIAQQGFLRRRSTSCVSLQGHMRVETSRYHGARTARTARQHWEPSLMVISKQRAQALCEIL